MCKIIICQKMNNHLWSWWICWFAVKNSFRFYDFYFVDFEKSSHDVLYKYIDICSIPNIFTFTVYQCAGCDVMTAESEPGGNVVTTELRPRLGHCHHWRPGQACLLHWFGLAWFGGPARAEAVQPRTTGWVWWRAGGGWEPYCSVLEDGGQGSVSRCPHPRPDDAGPAATWPPPWHGPGLHLLPTCPPHCSILCSNRYDIWFPWQK